MIKITKIETWGWKHAIRGMRNPLNSWNKSDSTFNENETYIGDADLDLMRFLYRAGTEHRKYLRQIFVTMDITAPLYWWKEADQYRIGVTTNSTSTMHTLFKEELSIDDFSVDHLADYNQESFEKYIEMLNEEIQEYHDTKDKMHWWQVIQMLPSSFNQKRTITMNYENVVTIIKQREGHKLDEWKAVCDKFKTLPYVKEIMEDKQ